MILEKSYKVSDPEDPSKFNNETTTNQANSALTLATKSSKEPLINAAQKITDYNHYLQSKLICPVKFKLALFHTALPQVFFGLLMALFGSLLVTYGAEMSQIGSGLWGGSFAVASGISGLIATSKTRCPLKSTAQKFIKTVFLILSLVSIALAQLVLVITFIGISRELKKDKDNKESDSVATIMLFNAALIVITGLQCICAIVASYRCSRMICPCFETLIEEEPPKEEKPCVTTKDMLLKSWLGKHNFPTPVTPPLYVVTSPNIVERRFHRQIVPIPPMVHLPPPMAIPLIPAPLGSIPSPTIYPHPRRVMSRRRRYSHDHNIEKLLAIQERRVRAKAKRKRQLTTEDLIRSYTGLDRVIAEEFIEICDSQSGNCDSSCNGSTAPASSGKQEYNTSDASTCQKKNENNTLVCKL